MSKHKPKPELPHWFDNKEECLNCKNPNNCNQCKPRRNWLKENSEKKEKGKHIES